MDPHTDSGPLVLLRGLRQAKGRFGSWLCKNAARGKLIEQLSLRTAIRTVTISERGQS
jgi:hypothetical protein